VGHELISKKTRYEFREHLVGWTLREIEGVFDSADIECNTESQVYVSGERRTKVEQYYASLDFTSLRDVGKLLKAYTYILNELSEPKYSYGQPVDNAERIKLLVRWLHKDGYDYVNGEIVPTGGRAAVASVRAVAQDFDGPHLSEQLKRIEAAVDSDPALAIGQAKELVETCCKSILTKRGVTDDFEKMDLGPLVKRTAKELALVPEAIPDAAKGADSIRRMLSNLTAVVQGLAEIRNLYGTGHGKNGTHTGLGPRHARLAVGTASTLVTFLFHTHTDRTKT